MSIIHQPWMESCHIMSHHYYESAIYYYNQQKKYFLQQVTKASNETELMLWQDKFLKKFTNEAINVGGVALENSEGFKKHIIEPIERLAQGLIESGQGQDLKVAIQNKANKSTPKDKNYLKNYSNRVKAQFDLYLETDSHIKDQLKKIYMSAFSARRVSDTAMSSMFSLFRRSMVSQIATNESMVVRLLSDHSIQGYIKQFKGYNAEIITEQAGQALLNKIGSKWTSQQIGSSGGISDIGFGAKKEIKSLEAILANIEKSAGTLTINANAQTIEPLAAYGAQVKSWAYPERVLDPNSNATQLKNKRAFYSIGERGDLLNSLGLNVEGKNSWWHYNIVAVAKNLIKAIGAANVLYVTAGNKYSWTADLIRDFRRANYYLSFYYRRTKGKFYYPPISTMTWQQEVEGYSRGKYGSKD